MDRNDSETSTSEGDAYPKTMPEALEAFMLREKLSTKAAARRIGISYNSFTSVYRGSGAVCRPTWARMNAFLGGNFPFPYKESGVTEGLWRKVPSWVRQAPREVRKALEQEYFVDAERADRFFKDVRTREDIVRARQRLFAEGLPKESSINWFI